MLKNKYYAPEFIGARLIVFAVTFLCGGYVVFVDNQIYLCNSEGVSCPLCGMKTAIHNAISLRFEQAFFSHPLV